MTKYFAGVGSRNTPQDVGEYIITRICPVLVKEGFILRSGGAEGADTFFEEGYRRFKGDMEIYLPWKNFNDNYSNLYDVSEEAMDIASQFHPAWDMLSRGARALQARNVYQVLGKDLNTPSSFVMCWTADGIESGKTTVKTGGTGQALRIAIKRGIPIINLGKKHNENII